MSRIDDPLEKYNDCYQSLLTRRRLVQNIAGTIAGGAAWSMLPGLAHASRSGSPDPRFLTVVLRGALDGLAMVAPIGDPHYAGLRDEFSLDQESMLPLDGLFALNPNMPNLATLFKKKQALFVHAAATSYRQRSHFDGQDILESGYDTIGGNSGWLNRALENFEPGDNAKPPPGLSMGQVSPLILRGDAPVMTWAPQALPQADEDTIRRVLSLYETGAPDLGRALSKGVEMDRGVDVIGTDSLNRNRRFAAEIDQAARFLRDPEGPRIAAFTSEGWDTHAGQNPVRGRMARLLKSLDKGIGRLAKQFEPVWHQTAILFITEFGRTARINGTQGTDHGTASCAILVGGAVKGGRVIADWPGLSSKTLLDGRDLQPTVHINAIAKGLLRDHLGMDLRRIDDSVFPQNRSVAPLSGLVG